MSRMSVPFPSHVARTPLALTVLSARDCGGLR
jgi:hypothetical protein